MHNLLTNPGAEDIDGIRIGIPLHHIRGHSTRRLVATISILSLTVNSARSPDEREVQVIQLASFKFGDCIDKLAILIRGAREEAKKHQDTFRDQTVVVDFGLGDGQHSDNDDSPSNKTNDQVICEHLGINFLQDVWGTQTFL